MILPRAHSPASREMPDVAGGEKRGGKGDRGEREKEKRGRDTLEAERGGKTDGEREMKCNVSSEGVKGKTEREGI